MESTSVSTQGSPRRSPFVGVREVDHVVPHCCTRHTHDRFGARRRQGPADDPRPQRVSAAGLVFQLHPLLPNQPVPANIGVVMFGTRSSPHEYRARARDLLAQVDLACREHRLATQLSGGEQQRVAIARALATHPKLLLADEPTGSLDSTSAANILEVFKRVHATGDTPVLVTHDAAIANGSDRIVRMKDGKVAEDG